MKLHITRKRAKEISRRVLCACGQADSYLENLLGRPDFYFTRVEGWACDGWLFDGYIITAGYASFGLPIGSYDYFHGWYEKVSSDEARYDESGETEKKVKQEFEKSLRQIIMDAEDALKKGK